jgi:hypothetical protein
MPVAHLFTEKTRIEKRVLHVERPKPHKNRPVATENQLNKLQDLKIKCE